MFEQKENPHKQFADSIMEVVTPWTFINRLTGIGWIKG